MQLLTTSVKTSYITLFICQYWSILDEIKYTWSKISKYYVHPWAPHEKCSIVNINLLRKQIVYDPTRNQIWHHTCTRREVIKCCWSWNLENTRVYIININYYPKLPLFLCVMRGLIVLQLCALFLLHRFFFRGNVLYMVRSEL